MNKSKRCRIFQTSKYTRKEEKRILLKEKRNIDLVKIEELLRECKFEIIDINHSPYEHQNFVVLIYNDYPIEVIFYYDQEKKLISLITAYPNRNYKFLLDK